MTCLRVHHYPVLRFQSTHLVTSYRREEVSGTTTLKTIYVYNLCHI